jgi:hypothetical protein
MLYIKEIIHDCLETQVPKMCSCNCGRNNSMQSFPDALLQGGQSNFKLVLIGKTTIPLQNVNMIN